MASRATALTDLARRLPEEDEEAQDLARRREVDRLTSRRPAGDGRVNELLRQHPDLLSDQPRDRQVPTHVTVVTDEDPSDHAQPAWGGEVHPEVERLLRQYGELIGHDPGEVIRPKSAAQRERQARREHHAGPGRTLTELHRGALRTAG